MFVEEENITSSVLNDYKSIKNFSVSSHIFCGTLDEACEKLAENLLKPNKLFNEMEKICSKIFEKTILSLFIDAAKRNINGNKLENILGNSDNEIDKATINTYKKHFDAFRDVLQTIGWDYPKVVGIDWSVLSVIESDDNNELEEPLAEISFKILPTDETNLKTFSFLCNKNELQDFQWKIKEAHNFLQNFLQK